MRSRLVAAVDGCRDEDGESDLLAGVGELAVDEAMVTRFVGLLEALDMSKTWPDAPMDLVLARGDGGLSLVASLLTVLLLTRAIQFENGDVPPEEVAPAPEDPEDLWEFDRTATALFLALTIAPGWRFLEGFLDAVTVCRTSSSDKGGVVPLEKPMVAAGGGTRLTCC